MPTKIEAAKITCNDDERTTLSDLDVIPWIEHEGIKAGLEMMPLTPELEKVAREELRETPENIKNGVEKLRELLKNEKNLKCPYDNDNWLIRFLRPCKFYPDSAFELIKRYYRFKDKHSAHYNGLLPSTEENIFLNDILFVLPYRDQHGRRILVIELGKRWDHKKVNLDEVFKGAVLYLEAAMLEQRTQVAGAIVAFNMDGLTLQQAWQFTPAFAKRIVDWLQEAMPIRIKNIHIINQPYIFNMVFKLFKPFLKEKLRSRIIFHGDDRPSLHKYVDPKVLPSEVGGELEVARISGRQWLDMLLIIEKEYKVINTYGYNK